MGTELNRRSFLAVTAALGLSLYARPARCAGSSGHRVRGVVIAPADTLTWPWPEKAAAAGINTIALHAAPADTEAFVKTDAGQTFLAACATRNIAVEYEQHAFGALLPRTLFEKNPGFFRMNDNGERVADANLCVSSTEAVALVCENARRFTATLQPTTHRHFFWLDDGQPMCRCPKCRELSDTEQALFIENAIIRALRSDDPAATLAHLCYHNTLAPPVQVKPEPGIFLEFAPIGRRHDRPLNDASIPAHVEQLGLLDANLAIFGAEGAQALEYWLDVSRFSGWKRENLTAIPWDPEVLRADAEVYAGRGIRNITTFAVWLDGEYVRRFGEPPLDAYGQGLAAIENA